MNLIPDWRTRAETIKPYAPAVAQAIHDCADELERQQRADAVDLVSLKRAALISGYDAKSLGKMIKAGKLVNHGTVRRPLVRRGDLPRKTGYHEPPKTEGAGADLADVALIARKRA